MSRPLIGITCYVEQVRWGVWDRPAVLLPTLYADAVRASGARALIVPPDTEDDGVLDVLDGLILAGGPDIDPARYGREPHPETDPPGPERDAGEFFLFRSALRRDLPVLGICRGMQVMAVATGGALIQHLPDVVGHTEHRRELGVYHDHAVRLSPDSLVGDLLGEDVKVNAYHHQAVTEPGTLTPVGWAEDGTIEALEDPDRRFVVGVQWHPETSTDHRLFTALTTAAAVKLQG